MTDFPDVWFKQRAVIKFLVGKNLKPVNAHRHLLRVYDDENLDVGFVRRSDVAD